MKTIVLALIAAIGITVGLGCQPADQKAARERAEIIEKKAESAAEQLGKDARQLGSKINEKAQEAGASRQSGSEPSAQDKLKRGAAELKREGQEAAAKLSQVAQSAKVKYNLSAALGVSAVSNIQVTSSGNTVTLQGRVPSSEARAEAERVALGTQSVTKVINQLRVEP